MSNTKRILNGHVARVIGGVLVTAGPGDAAPDWVTNPALIDAPSAEPASTDASQPPAPAPSASKPAPSDENTDDLSGLGIKELRDLAEATGVAKSGSKSEIADRIRAKRSEAKPQGDAGAADDEATDRDALVTKATDLGIEDAENLTDDELNAAIESLGE